jgi:uncharacterized protein YhaN
MRLRLISGEEFGRLRGWESPELESGIIVIYGPNEAGKSTLFNLISTILYGWSPASRETSPYVPWDGAMASCRAVLTVNSQETRIYRRLRSRPEGTMTSGGNILDLGNGPIPCISFIQREIFDEIFALTLDQLRFPSEAVWQKLQDQLLGGQYASFLIPAADAASNLEAEANSLWRGDRHGNPREKQLRQALNNLNQKLLEAEKNERDLHKKEEQLYDLRHELEGLVERKKALAVAMDRFERLYPAKRMLKSIDELTQSCGNIDRYDILPDDPAAAVSDIEKKTAEMESSLSDLDLQRQKALENINACTDRDVSIFSHSLDINSIVKSYSQIESDISSSHDLAVQMEGLKSRLIERGELLFKGGWVPGYAEMLRKLDVQALRDSIDAFSGADDDCREQEARIAGLKARAGGSGKTKYIPFLAGAFFLSGTAGTVLLSRSIPGYISTIFMAVGVCMLVMWQLFKGGSVSPTDIRDAEAFLGKRRRDRESFLKEVNESLYGLSIAQKRIMSPGDSLLVDINMLRDLLRSYEDAAERKRVVNRRLQEKAGAIDRLFAECSLEHRLSMLDDIVMLEGLLDEAESRRKTASSSREDIQDIDRSMEVIKEQLQKAAVRKKHIIDMLNTIEGPDLEQKVKTLAARRGMRQRAQTLREELDRNYPKPESILREEDTASIAQLLEPDAAAAAKTDMEDLDRRINDLNSRMGALRNELERSRNDESLSDIRGQIEAVNKERRIIGYKRDRLILVKNLILEADRLFREENKPDILKKTGDFLGIITDGKYDHVFS